MAALVENISTYKDLIVMDSPPLNAIRVFTIAARIGSFKQTAEELYLTPGAVSRQIQHLENYLGVKLFERKYRTISLTRIGELYLAQIEPALLAINQSSQNVKRLTETSTVRVESTPTFAMYWLIPRLKEFQRQESNIEIILTTAQGNIDPNKEIDVFIRRNHQQFSGLSGVRFMTEWSSLVCSPQFVVNHKKLIAEIGDFRLICIKSRPDLWRKWLNKYINGFNYSSSFLEFDNTILAIQATLEGLGIALIPNLFLVDLLQRKTLIEVQGYRPLQTGYYHMLCPDGGKRTEVQTFTNWLSKCGSYLAP